MRTFRIIEGDSLEALKAMPDASVDACVTDPPYDLTAVSRGGSPRVKGSGPFGRVTLETKGFMGKAWDGTGIAFNSELWFEVLRVLKPGGHLLSFGGTRTYHRMACAIEDAGFEIRDCIQWLYGSGFPKSLDVSKAIDKRGGNPHLTSEIGRAIKKARERRGLTVRECDERFCGGTTNWTWFEGRPTGQRAPNVATFARIAAAWPELSPLAETVAEVERETVGTSAHRSGIGNGTKGHYTVGGTKAEQYDITAPATSEAEQWQGWGTALKPACEPIVVARKPLSEPTVAANVLTHGTGAINVDACRVGIDPSDDIHTKNPHTVNQASNQIYGAFKAGSEYVVPPGRWPANVVMDEEAGAMLDEQTGELKSGDLRAGIYEQNQRRNIYGTFAGFQNQEYKGDSGGASRFFYCAKADRQEREAGLDGLSLKVHGMSGGAQSQGEGYDKAQSIGLNRVVRVRNTHPTVKPISLMCWLVRLITPEGGTVLDPFTGSGSTGIAALREGFNFIGIERESEYVEIARRRIIGDAPLINREAA